MKKMLLALIVFALFLPGGCGGEKGPLNLLPENGVILAFGDSLTYGTGAAAGKSYPEVLERITGRRVVRSGVPGEETEAGLKRLPSVLDAVRPDLVILCHGGNDLLRRRDLRRTAGNLKTMIAMIRDRGGQVVLVGVPALGLGLRTSPMYKTVAEETKTPYLAETLTEILSSGDLKADYIHPNGKGYARMAAAIADFLVTKGALTAGDVRNVPAAASALSDQLQGPRRDPLLFPKEGSPGFITVPVDLDESLVTCEKAVFGAAEGQDGPFYDDKAAVQDSQIEV